MSAQVRPQIRSSRSPNYVEPGVDEQVLALYARGMTVRDIQSYLAKMYGSDVSPDLISKVTDAVNDEITVWQSRPLDSLWPVVYIDALWIKVRDGKVANRPVYLAVGVDLDGCKHVLGLWIGKDGEGARQWLTILGELKARGIEDVLVACCDGLPGLPDAINAVWPRATVQTCVIHRSRQETTWWISAPIEVRRSAAVGWRCPAGAMSMRWSSRIGRTSRIAFHKVLLQTPNSSARASRPQTWRR